MRGSNGLYRDAQVKALAVIDQTVRMGYLHGLPELIWHIGLEGAFGQPSGIGAAEQLAELEAWAAALGKSSRVTAQGTRTVVDLKDGMFLSVDHPAGVVS